MFSANAVWPSTERCTREVLYLFLRNPKPRNAFGYRFEQFSSMLRSCLPNVYPEFDSYTLHFKNSWLNRFRISFKGKRQWSYNVIQITSYHLKQCNTIQYNATQRNAMQFYSKQYNILTTPWWDSCKSSALQTVHFLSLF